MCKRCVRCQRRPAIRNRGQRVIVDIHQGSGVFGNVAIIGDDDRNRFSHMNNFLMRECRSVPVLFVQFTG